MTDPYSGNWGRIVRPGGSGMPRPMGSGLAGRMVRPMGSASSRFATHRCYSADGVELWHADHGSRVTAMARDSSGNFYTTSISGNAIPISGLNVPKLHRGGGALAKWTSAGRLLWRLYLDGDPEANGVAVDASDNAWFITDDTCYQVSPAGTILLSFDQSALAFSDKVNAYGKIAVNPSTGNIVIATTEVVFVTSVVTVQTYSTAGSLLGVGSVIFGTSSSPTSIQGLIARGDGNVVVSTTNKFTPLIQYEVPDMSGIMPVANFYSPLAGETFGQDTECLGLAYHAGSDTYISRYRFSDTVISPFYVPRIVDFQADLSVHGTTLLIPNNNPTNGNLIGVGASRRFVIQENDTSPDIPGNTALGSVIKAVDYPSTVVWTARFRPHPNGPTSIGNAGWPGNAYEAIVDDSDRVIVAGDRVYA